jgi:hypothetical protein
MGLNRTMMGLNRTIVGQKAATTPATSQQDLRHQDHLQTTTKMA